jgi:hypothetical protein
MRGGNSQNHDSLHRNVISLSKILKQAFVQNQVMLNMILNAPVLYAMPECGVYEKIKTQQSQAKKLN